VITVGVKDANYLMVLNQYQDNGKTVGWRTDLYRRPGVCHAQDRL